MKNEYEGWRSEYIDIKSHTLSNFQIELLEHGPKSLSQSWILQAMFIDWKRIKGIKDDGPLENKGQMQSSLKEFFQKTDQRDQGI
tara:strand:+ start:299 stop:553 length:255 start_codon:yes stop_codon:yes gene_type:complete